jgi:hypothetical protein
MSRNSISSFRTFGSDCRPKTEQKSAAPPEIAFQSLFYRFVGAVQKQHRPGDPIDEQARADEDDDSRHR